jgi:hypothetical protein
LIVGVGDLTSALADQLKTAGVEHVYGVKAARDRAVAVINQQLGVKG